MKKKYADMDPLEEIRAIREEIGREFETVLDLGKYLREKSRTALPKGPKRQGRASSAKAGARPLSPRREKNAKA